MDRYIAGELIPPFLFGVGAFSSVGVAIGTVFDLVRKVTELGLPITIALEVLLLKLPEFVSYAFPMSILLATLMTYSRLSSDSELIALRSCGVTIYRLVIPALVLSLIVTGITFLFNEIVVPTANYQATMTLRQALDDNKSAVKGKNIFYPEYEEITQPDGEKTQELKRLFYASRFDGERMKGLTVLDWSQEQLNQIVTSESATWNSKQNTWDFVNGTIYLIAPDASYRDILRFDKQKLQLPRTPLDLASEERDPYEMNIAQTSERIELLKLTGDEKKILMLQVRLQQKISFPFVCLVFGLVGAVLGSSPKSMGKARSFGISVVVIFSYYLLGFIIGGFGLVGIISPFMAAWLPNFFGLGAGGLLLVKAAR
ncbi:MAG: YjgP/YjgQ family permease [Symploca sp. SIO2D2]|nr:YjgP/YjgQ family permease [Symploca sp. SIO2D2]